MVNWPVFPLVFLLTVIARWWKKDTFPVKKESFFLMYLLPWLLRSQQPV